MFGYGKMSGTAVAAMSALAESHKQDRPMSSQDIAKTRNLSPPLVAKVLTVLAQGGLVRGSRGPGGGYRLARPPAEISVLEVIELFEGHREVSACPFGPGWCGVRDPCPLHDTLTRLREISMVSFQEFSFEAFAKNPKPE
jgi:Rrf2 family protein